MKITTQQIKQIINEELDKLLYEEENNDVLRKALAKNILDADIDKHYQKIKNFVIKATQDLNIQQQMQSANQMLQSNDNEQIEQAYDLFLGLIQPVENDTKKQREDKEKVLKQIEPFEQFIEAKDQKSFLANVIIKTKGLRKANLRFANLSGADLSGADLSFANLIEADLSGANLSGADLNGAYLSKADLSKADLSKANLLGASLPGANLGGADLSKAVLRAANLSGAGLSGAKLIRANLREANLREANLSAVDLSDASLSNAYLDGANLSGAKLSRISLFYAKYNDRTQWPEGFDPVADGAKKV